MNIFKQMKQDAALKKYLTGTALLIAVLLIISAAFIIRDYADADFIFNGERFKPAKVSARSITFRDTTGNTLYVIRQGSVAMAVEYKGMTIRFGGGYGGLTGIGYAFSDGTIADPYSNPEYTRTQLQEINMLNSLRDYFNTISLKHKYPLYYILLVILVIAIIAICMYHICYTEQSCERSMRINPFVREGEPTELALFATKAFGHSAIITSFAIFISVMNK